MLTKTNDRLKTYADRISRLEEERGEIAEQIKEAFADAQSEGFRVSALKQAIKIAGMDKLKRAKHDASHMDKLKRAKHDASQMDLEIYLAQLEGRETE